MLRSRFRQRIDMKKQAWKGIVDGVVKDKPRPMFNGKYSDIYMKFYNYGLRSNYITENNGVLICNICRKRLPNKRVAKVHFSINHRDYVVKHLPEDLKYFFDLPSIKPLV